ncbi:MAG: ATP-binding cassette domain-containing protein [Acidimicrobiia bacterium]|nr:ATP-binding cassette domain-containing protein [Acidimicrobiia bacterium]
MSLQLREIHKHFGPVRANDGVSIEVEAGELHGLLGENGAGKSTLMKVLSGFHPADSGDVILEGRTLDLGTPDAAVTAGIGMLHQDPLVFLPFTVIDNFLLGSPGRTRVDRKEGARKLREASERYGFTFDPDALARTLSVGERQQLEIARLLWLGARVLILDEPTTGISATQRDKLFEILRRLAADGMIVIFVSHKLEEVEALCDRVTVMRQGTVVGSPELPVPTSDLVEMMFGSVIVEGARPDVAIGRPALTVEKATLEQRLVTVRDLSLTVGAGEILGLAGLEGSGQRALLRACTGLLRPAAGSIAIGGTDTTGLGYHGHKAAGVHYLPAGRLEEGLVEGLTLSEHFELVSGDTSFFVDWDRARDNATDLIGGNFIKGTAESTADALSGGNQQRLLLAMMPDHITVLLMEHPTRGLDIESAEWVWTRLLARRSDGTAIVFASADLDELLRYSDRVAVFFSGRVIDTVDAKTTTPEQLGHLIGGKASGE